MAVQRGGRVVMAGIDSAGRTVRPKDERLRELVVRRQALERERRFAAQRLKNTETLITDVDAEIAKLEGQKS